uniref:MACPF domain-containing protein n=1 Tax=Sphaeramia orbicularis TaxID=375764 RepID=A0A672YPD6_9TELE
MGIYTRLLLGLCTLHLVINFSRSVNSARTQWTTADNRCSIFQSTRAVNRPVPISCRLGGWSPWTSCNSCTDKKFRFRHMEKPSQFGGTQCIETLWERLACPTATTQCLEPDYCGESFTCKDSGRCISQSLRCNGETDCDDFSDEEECEEINQRHDKCSTLMPIPGAERGTQGYNILTGDFVNYVLDPNYYGGTCEYVYNGEWRKFTYDSFCENLHYNEEDKNFRKPYNYHTYRFVAQATSEGSHEYFEDMVSLLNARKTLDSSNAGFTLGIDQVEFGLSGSRESEFLSNMTKFKSQDLGFVHLTSKVQTALFKMRSDKLMLHEDFYIALMELPEQYDFGVYSHFFNTFGTHYVTEGSMGGTLEYVVVINKTSTAQSSTEGLQWFSLSLWTRSRVSQMDIPLRFDSQLLNQTSLRQILHITLIKDIITLVKGGISVTSSGLLTIRNTDTYRKWGASLKYNPALIDYEIMPIYELVRLSTAAEHVGARLANLQRSWDEYLQQFHSCRCAPCRHNGIPILSGTSCSCLCKSGYQGEACEETMRRDRRTDGSWSCWGPWSVCASGRKTRTRTCNNPSPDEGGAACLGSTSQTQRC